MYEFFRQQRTQQALRRLAKAEQLTVFVGAGASKEVGFPTWGELVSNLTEQLVPKRDRARPSTRVVHDFVQASGPLAAAERIGASLGGSEELSREIRAALYGQDDPGSLLPGPTARAVARLKASAPTRTRVVTTNYDQTLVQAMRDAGLEQTKSYCINTSAEQAVIHLHGVIGFASPADGTNEIVLTERDFLAPKAGGWRRDVVESALEAGPCLFVGASLTDLNLLSPLYRTQSRHRHVVLFTNDPRWPRDAAKRIRLIEQKRWRGVGVECLMADNYSDTSSFVREIALRRTEPDLAPLSDRLHAWQRRAVDPLRPDEATAYAQVQGELSGKLVRLLAAIRHTHELDDEVLQLGVFVLRLHGESEGAEVLVTSDRIMTDPRSAELLELRRESNWTGVKAMCSAVPLSEPKDHYASRWKNVLAVPVQFDDLAAAPVGAVVLSSTNQESALGYLGGRRLLTDQYALLYDELAEAGRRLLAVP